MFLTGSSVHLLNSTLFQTTQALAAHAQPHITARQEHQVLSRAKLAHITISPSRLNVSRALQVTIALITLLIMKIILALLGSIARMVQITAQNTRASREHIGLTRVEWT